MNYPNETKMIRKINDKIITCRENDIKVGRNVGDIDCKFILNMLKEQNNKCYVCNDDLILYDWKPYCCYQFSIDRLKEYESHNKDNIKISCYYCNCFKLFDIQGKICKSNCHVIERKDVYEKALANDNIKCGLSQEYYKKERRVARCKYISFFNEEYYSCYDVVTSERKYGLVIDEAFNIISNESSYVIDYANLKNADPIEIMYKKIFNSFIPEGNYNKLVALEQLYFHINGIK